MVVNENCVERLGYIRRSSDYRMVYERGVKLVGRYYVLFYVASDRATTRTGITVSSKVGGAVVRNRAKRRTRQAVKAAFEHVTPNGDIVLVALGRIKDAPYYDLVEDLKRLLRKAAK
jgi:ribonuclease P protein component